MPDVIVEVDSRPVEIEVGVGPETLRDILTAIEAARARAAGYGISDPLLATAFIDASVEADFAQGIYRRGHVLSTSILALQGWTFTRTGAGTAPTAADGVVSFATGAPRITDVGLTVETATTNILPFSQQLDDASWSKIGAVAVTANSAYAPDGTLTADRLQLGAAAAYVSKTTSGGLTAGAPVTFSFWARGTGTIGVRSGATAVSPVTRVLTSTWQRFSWTFNGGTSEVFQLTNNNLVPGASATIDADIWGVQVEGRSYASSYVPTTTAAATRAKDDASFVVAASEGGVFVDVNLPAHAPPSGSQALASWSNGSDRHLMLVRTAANMLLLILYKPDGIVQASVAGFGGARRLKAFFGWGAGQMVWAVDGVERTASPLPLPLNLSIVRPGSDFVSTDKLSGSVRRLLIATRLPTLAQRIAMTA